ncbi:uncharacterized protein BO97DRAFT_409901 [Aspergillus homomorphus CBS 101889]|uniref:Uncharacterized protein n=1 Tax=Aspergillus homomorphus (strain CBS 101889) TaxID=1450537 RepID=A0A395IE80_ASPHC|nr:hypothetical protein BO97DRAFT_409901 [Aspergillus homomorphus CBS 101889]RAL17473.1 hypothetical protein BO97DRAFT_409901 [Aspergillus homomorphus CBS 101889]
MENYRPIENTSAYYEKLGILQTRCASLLGDHEEPATTWTLGEPAPPTPPRCEVTSRYTSQWQDWPLVRGLWDPEELGWPPAGVRLTDAWVYLAIKYLTAHDRYRKYYADFNFEGIIRPWRVPIGETIMVSAHGLLTYPVYMGWYVLCGSGGRSHQAWQLCDFRDIRRGGVWPISTLTHGLVFPSLNLTFPHIEELKRHTPHGWMSTRRHYRRHMGFWVTCLNDTVIVYTRNPQGYAGIEIKPFNDLNPRATCTDDPGSDLIRIRPGALPFPLSMMP